MGLWCDSHYLSGRPLLNFQRELRVMKALKGLLTKDADVQKSLARPAACFNFVATAK